jgi:glycine betaine transporter
MRQPWWKWWVRRRYLAPRHRPGTVLVVSLLLLAAFVALGAAEPEAMGHYAGQALGFTTQHFGWLYLFITTAFLVFCLTLALSRYGDIRLGADDETPEFPYTTWLGMIFSAGMGVGLVFWGVAEPMSHYNEPPLGLAEPRTADAARLAMRYSAFHWGFHQWANFAVVGLAIAYVRFRQQRGGLISEAFRASLGSRVDGFWGHAINVLAVISTIFGVATTLGLGTIQINSGLDRIDQMAFGVDSQLKILLGTGVVFVLAALTPLEKGVRYVSDLNMLLALLLLLFVLFLGPTDFILVAMTTTVGDYFANVLGMSLLMNPFSEGDWTERWTIFYWAWGLSWAPFVGSFIARISRGRTIREFVVGVMGVPVALSILWFAAFGGSALYYEYFQGAGVADAVAQEVSSGLFVTLDQLPLSGTVTAVALVLVVLFVVTSANSATFVLGMFTARGALNPGRWLRVTWGVIQLLVAGVLLLSGGLQALQTISVLAAFPFMILMVFMVGSFFRSLKAERRAREEADRQWYWRVERMLEEADAAHEERERRRL